MALMDNANNHSDPPFGHEPLSSRRRRRYADCSREHPALDHYCRRRTDRGH